MVREHVGGRWHGLRRAHRKSRDHERSIGRVETLTQSRGDEFRILPKDLARIIRGRVGFEVDSSDRVPFRGKKGGDPALPDLPPAAIARAKDNQGARIKVFSWDCKF